MQGQEPVGSLDDRWWDFSSFHHAVVHQATGVLMGESGASAAEAFVRLRSYALTNDLSIDRVARAVVDRELRIETDAETSAPPK